MESAPLRAAKELCPQRHVGSALVMDSAGRLWLTGSELAVVVPGTLTAYPVARTPDLIAAAADGPGIWVGTGSALTRKWTDSDTSRP